MSSDVRNIILTAEERPMPMENYVAKIQHIYTAKLDGALARVDVPGGRVGAGTPLRKLRAPLCQEATLHTTHAYPAS